MTPLTWFAGMTLDPADFEAEIDYLLSGLALRLRAVAGLARVEERAIVLRAITALRELPTTAPARTREALMAFYDEHILSLQLGRDRQGRLPADLRRCMQTQIALIDALKDWQRAISYLDALLEAPPAADPPNTGVSRVST